MARYAKANTLLTYLDISRSTLDRRVLNDPTFPRPIYVGRMRRFDLDEIDAWLASQPTTSPAANDNTRKADYAAA
ncbi:AlpA family transcriptional regulator [Rhodopseudomonas faecalis]|uniref:AlpA family transcriptional regulator n=1 Tax=Rhodopseudomonas faecalis TaxID=99655 RepID=A0A318TFC5_9BRAD|nr:AlpA family phage regulatory protein [Rhodopseudomonas faecalis]PYF02547.1 AlpA family transcriptional regulator [Rhodopseudomonas faecalis]